VFCVCQFEKRNGCRQLTNTTAQVPFAVSVIIAQITFKFNPLSSGKGVVEGTASTYSRTAKGNDQSNSLLYMRYFFSIEGGLFFFKCLK